MQTSSRLANIKPSVTLAINAKAQELRAGGADVISFGVGRSRILTPRDTFRRPPSRPSVKVKPAIPRPRVCRNCARPFARP